ncbi:MAG: phosphoribosylpyrophosphate synthetase [Flavobacteriales bacterium]
MSTPAYSTLSEAVNDLQRRGYTDDLVLAERCLVCDARSLSLDPADFHIDELHRFEGNSDPEDQSIVYAIRSDKHGLKGILVNAYGPDASSLTQEMVSKLSVHR